MSTGCFNIPKCKPDLKSTLCKGIKGPLVAPKAPAGAIKSEYGFFKRPCFDVYPPGKNHVTTAELGVMSGMKTEHVQSMSEAHSQKLRAAFQRDKVWKPGQTIRICFLTGTKAQHDWVKGHIKTNLEPLVNLKFLWDQPCDQSDVRITFDWKLGAWSQIGTAALAVDKTQATINLGWLDTDLVYPTHKDYDNPTTKGTGAVILHEFGHMMGMIHEQQNPRHNPICWNKPCIYSKLSQPPNSWSRAQINLNMFKKYSQSQINGSSYDPDSIMEYFFPGTWVICGPMLKINTTYSPRDKQWLNCAYPKDGQLQFRDCNRFAKKYGVKPEHTQPGQPGQPGKPGETAWIWITIGIIGGVLLAIIITAFIIWSMKNNKRRR